MPAPEIVWDLEGDPRFAQQHDGEQELRKSRHLRLHGEGRYLAVVWEHVQDDPLTIYPITAYDAPEPRRRRR